MPGLMTFRATLRRTGCCCSAMKTTPMPPSPICSSSYGAGPCPAGRPEAGPAERMPASGRRRAAARPPRRAASPRAGLVQVGRGARRGRRSSRAARKTSRSGAQGSGRIPLGSSHPGRSASGAPSVRDEIRREKFRREKPGSRPFFDAASSGAARPGRRPSAVGGVGGEMPRAGGLLDRSGRRSSGA